MTSGTQSFGQSPTGVMVANSYGWSRNWSGGNGRTETVGGRSRPKWNNYTLEYRSRLTGSINYAGRFKISPTGGGNWTPFNQVMANPHTAAGTMPALTPSEILLLQQRLLDRVKKHNFQMGVAVAEGKKTVQTVVNTLGTLGRSFRELRRGNLPQAMRELGLSGRRAKTVNSQDAASRWLELQYGWKPLISDCYEAVKAFENVTSPPRKTTVRASYSRKRTVTFTNSIWVKATIKQRRRMSIVYEIEENLSAQRSVGLYDPLSIAWETLPYSFVIDWFIPIGTYLENLNQIPHLRGRFLTSTSYECYEPEYTELLPYNYIEPNQHFDRVLFLRKDVTRVVSTSLDVPKPFFNRDGLQKGNRIWNAIALARTAFGQRAPGALNPRLF